MRDARHSGVEGAGPPRLLVVSTQPWPAPARLCMALRRAGFHVEGASLPRAYLRRSSATAAWHRMRSWRLLADLRRAVTASRPDRVVPGDDVSVALLVALHNDPSARGLVEASLGDPSAYPVALSKGAQMALATELGVTIPPTLPVPDRAAFDLAMGRGGFPRVLKVDGTWGGGGLAVLGDAAAAGPAWTRLTTRPSLVAAARSSVRERSLRGFVARRDWRPSTPHLQGFAEGRPANRAVLCDGGRVVAGLSVVALRTAGASGPACVVEVVDHPGMAAAADAFIGRLGLSGFHGFDFILSPDGQALLLEMNPRATPICHLAEGDGHGLAAALRRVTGGPDLPLSLPAPGTVIALFPNEWARDPGSPHLRGRHDVPWEDPPLLRTIFGDLATTGRLERARDGLRRLAGR